MLDAAELLQRELRAEQPHELQLLLAAPPGLLPLADAAVRARGARLPRARRQGGKRRGSSSRALE